MLRPVQSRVPLDTSLTAETLIVKEEYVRFLELTQLDKTRPQADLSELSVTAAGRYDELLTHIRAHRYFMALERRQPEDPKSHVPLERVNLTEAAADWYDCVFTPTSRIITDRLLEHFDNRTKADLYLWLSNHHRALEEHLGWHIPQDVAASDLLSHFSKRTQQPQRPAFADQHAPQPT